MWEPFKDREHLVRMAALFGAGLIAFVLFRGVLIPADFGDLGHYRAGALDDNRAQPRRYAGSTACEECHDDIAAERAGSAHQAIGCEACHGALNDHAGAPDEVLPELPDPSHLCASCHGANVAKPAKFPQVNVQEHAEDEPCTECHLPHQPGV